MLRSKITLWLIAAVILTILIIAGCDDLITQTQPTEIVAYPTADFTYSPVSGCAPLVVTFRDASSGPVVQWRWIFGDGDTVVTDTGYIQHTYDTPGAYKVTLWAYDTLGYGDFEEKLPYSVSVGQTIAGFTTSVDSGCAGMEVKFRPYSYNGVSSWKWQYGDGDSSTDSLKDSQPTHVYTAEGTHEVRLIVHGNCGGDTLYDTVQVSLCPQANFLAEATCQSREMKFSDKSIPPDVDHPINQWYWTFGESKTCHQQDTTITFSTAGLKTVTLTVTSTGGGSATYSDTVRVFSTTTADFGATPTESCKKSWRQFIVKYTNLTTGPVDSFVWWFGDGDSSWNDPSPAHAYIVPGIYTPKLIVYRCTSVLKDSLLDGIVYSDSLANPLFSVDPPDSGSTSTSFTFADTSSGVITDWTWKIEGPGWDTTVNDRTTFTKSFATAGTYKVRLTIGNQCGVAVDSATFQITSE